MIVRTVFGGRLLKQGYLPQHPHRRPHHVRGDPLQRLSDRPVQEKALYVFAHFMTWHSYKWALIDLWNMYMH